MISIVQATERDCQSIADIGKTAVEESHRGSSSVEVMTEFLERNYNPEAIREELHDSHNIYYIIQYNGESAGFSKIVLNDSHPDIGVANVTKLDRIYLRKEFYGQKLGLQLLNFNINLAKDNGQSGMWLYAWIGNNRAIDFYRKAGFMVIGSHNYYVTETHFDVSHRMFLSFSER
ncbi:GNAT family N-acetyltransferase [Chryseolinea lacunae]|uniref:GNAT family N-acetyltransferase n=1 Tax=Chryseolinea lacunae TaxID=2801331 RepID=A0ABS1KUQ1_9BACT|nr:N-acetyltransferase [Chryseolinea lacunae]MBL0743033.1 GNAT family N-acetyltransferase [Chryseolinea lacunae]